MSLEPITFLIVDDLEENLTALEALLRRDGLTILKARSGAEALELLLVQDVALALLDVQMPEMNGFELAELMRGFERTRAIPIIFVTALPSDETRRFRGYETGAVDYLQKPIDAGILKSKTGVFFELARQRQELAHNSAQLTQALAQLRAHANNSPLAFVDFDQALTVTAWSQGAERLLGFSARDVVGRPFRQIGWLEADEAERFAAEAARLLEEPGDGRAVEEFRLVHRDGSVRVAEWYISALGGGGGVRPTRLSLSVQILDITERRRAEETQRLLMGELNHRVKNTLATVQAIASHTLRHVADPGDFAGTFSGRIQSLSKAHALLSATSWSGATLEEILREQLSLGSLDPARFVASGPAIQLKPQQALHLAMILHELATNAGKYGAHSVPTGRITLDWTLADGALDLVWQERGGPSVGAITRKGFGSRLIQQSARAEGGDAQMQVAPEGLTWRLKLVIGQAPSTLGAGSSDLPALSAPAKAGSGFRQAQQPQAIPPQALPEKAAEPEPKAKKRILIIEDEPLVALDLAERLEEAGFDIAGSASDMSEAMVFARDSAADAVLLDGNLRGEPVDAVAQVLSDRSIPFIFVTGYTQESLPSGFRHLPLLSKPFTDRQLFQALDRLLPAQG
ncbi:hypothetical protein BJF93_15505 [Xaviernesmea oryzae]|uniref:Blue-light-activated histidine kinase n=1 Tax=Xaviernesmea oryzae TaxID=464029 RepID=A0A1Q9AY46_9HYPH|nr:response regulator [Xaviernesmea oryzae]OLP60357.1 hypothetical protein BJF93_15505 [Xaviernesmea oryzae]SEK21783.1 PAS domain S-box-containing protein [Xaviernesmea oryzae]